MAVWWPAHGSLDDSNASSEEQLFSSAIALGAKGQSVLIVDYSSTSVGCARLVDTKGVDYVSSAKLAALYPRSDQGSVVAFIALAIRRASAQHLTHMLKVFVADCDQTLWGGVVSEDGVAGLSFRGPHQLLQERLSELQRRGRLVCLASRNDEDDVMKVFAQRQEEMPLKLSQLSAWQVNWGSKAVSIRRLASELRLGLEAFVFLDDNPGETEIVRRAHPQVLTVTVPGGDEGAFERLLRHHWALDAWSGSAETAEDTRRTQMYRENALRKEARREAPSYAVFLQSLHVHVEIRPPVGPEFARVSQLSQRTNQMNSTQVRFASEDRLREWLADGEGRWVVAAWVSDRFGDYGLVASAICTPGACGEVIVECLNMSCRVLHRGVEQAVLRQIAEDAQLRGLSRVLLPFVQTTRNALMRNFLDRIAGWAQVPTASDGPSVTIGRFGEKRGVVSNSLEMRVDKLQELQVCHTDTDDDTTRADEGAEIEAAEVGEERLSTAAAASEAVQASAVINIAATPGDVSWTSLLDHLASLGDELPGATSMRLPPCDEDRTIFLADSKI
eukprot:TRINITY_DN55819_c0_g1_i1.p1 TRINITY_DN55819_c0_g1~~TRINITY_DN55819_c0_g1_i1.p1  ORF type:complete len:579 (+),score=80.23 TRINITY_DN55819_c0_g1_i1:63-1739(+)